MRLRLTREADFDEIRICEIPNFCRTLLRCPPLAGFCFSGSCVLQKEVTGRDEAESGRAPRECAGISLSCRGVAGKRPIAPALPDRRAVPSFASIPLESQGASFLRSRHASGITARAAEGTPLGGVAKRSTARLRAVAGASTLLGWGHGRRQNDLRRPLAALRMSAALPPTA